MKNPNVLSILLGSVITICSTIVIENLVCMFCVCHAIDTLPFSLHILMIGLNVAVAFMAGSFPMIIGSEHLKHTIIIGTITTLFAGINFYLMSFPLWYHLASALLLLPSCYLGGYVFKKAALNSFSPIKPINYD